MIFILLIFKVIMTYRRAPTALPSLHHELKLENRSLDSERDGDFHRVRGHQEVERMVEASAYQRDYVIYYLNSEGKCC